MAADSEDVFARLERGRDQAVAELCDFLRIPSISTDPEYAGEVGRAADWLLERLAAAGLTTEKIATERPPAGLRRVDGRRRRPADRPDLRPLRRAAPRSARRVAQPAVRADDRGGTAGRPRRDRRQGPDATPTSRRSRRCSPSAARCRSTSSSSSRARRSRAASRSSSSCATTAASKLACDCVVVSDTSMWAPGVPAITYGLQGPRLLRDPRPGARTATCTPGVFGGGVETRPTRSRRSSPRCATRRPAASDPRLLRRRAAARRLGARGVRRRSASTRTRSATTSASPALAGEEGYSYVERTWARPTCDVNGLWSGYQGEGAKTVLPARAGCKVSFRLVADQTPGEDRRAGQGARRQVAPAGVKVRSRRSTAPRRSRSTPPARTPRPRSTRSRTSGARARGAHPHRRLDPDRRYLRGTCSRYRCCCWASASRMTACTPPTRSSTSSTSTTARARSCGCSTGSGAERRRAPKTRAPIERELKFAEVDLDCCAGRLLELEAERVGPPVFEDNWLLDRGGELAERAAVLRVRQDGRGAMITFKGPASFEGAVQAARRARDAGRERRARALEPCSPRSATGCERRYQKLARSGGSAPRRSASTTRRSATSSSSRGRRPRRSPSAAASTPARRCASPT